MQGNATQQSSPGASVSRTFSAQRLHTQTQAGTTTRFIYDGRGNTDCSVKNAHSGESCPAAGSTNLIDDSIYDERNALTGYRYYNGAASASKTIDYTVDPLERPLKQVETISGSTTTYDFTYVGITSALSKEVLTGSGATTKRYSYDVFGNRATISGGSNRYSYMYDPHGSVSLLLDHNAVAKESYGYSGYGSANAALTRSASGFNAKTNPYRYTGKRLDSGSGTYDMGARRYSASTGRFLQYALYYSALDNLGLSEDPLTQNRYALAGGNSVNFIEIDGHSWRRVFCPRQFTSLVPGCDGRKSKLDRAMSWLSRQAERSDRVIERFVVKHGASVATVGCVVATSGTALAACLVIVSGLKFVYMTGKFMAEPSGKSGATAGGSFVAHQYAIVTADALQRGKGLKMTRERMGRACQWIIGGVSALAEQVFSSPELEKKPGSGGGGGENVAM